MTTNNQTSIASLAKQCFSDWMQQLYEWLNQHQLTVPSSSPITKAINYTLKRWPALSRYLDDGNLPIDMSSMLRKGLKTRCDLGRWDVRIGYLQVRCAAVSEQPIS